MGKYKGKCDECGFVGNPKRKGSTSGGFISVCPNCGLYISWCHDDNRLD